MFQRYRKALAPLISGLVPGKQPALPPDNRVPMAAAVTSPSAEDMLSIPINEHSEEDAIRRRALDRGQFLARQDRWDDLAEEARAADRARAASPGGMPIADLLLFGARSDAVQAVEHALLEGFPDNDAPLLRGITSLEVMRTEHPDDMMLALVVALAHIDMAWAWRGYDWDLAIPARNREAFGAHFERAVDLLKPFSGEGGDSPIMAAARCAILAGATDPRDRLVREYEHLIDLNPQNFRHLRTFGTQLLPIWFGSLSELELQARRIAARTQQTWGAGGYTWVCFDAIAADADALAQIDGEFFIEGLRDIAARRSDQDMINLLCAYCAIAIRHGEGVNPAADPVRRQIADCAGWLIRDHLTEVHPLIWAHAAEGFDNNVRISSLNRFAARGRADALRVITDQFRDDIDRGLRVTFTDEGPHLHPA